MTRLLHHIPILHTDADLGALAPAARRALAAVAGEDAVARRDAVIAALWDRVDAWAESVEAPPAGLFLYQDGMPVCGREMDIARDLAAAGSRNHRALLRLAERGATLLGSESPALLLEEYRLASEAAAGGSPGSRDPGRAREILAKRDRFIADRIDRTLPPGAHGALFLGMLHDAVSLLPADIRVHTPLPP